MYFGARRVIYERSTIKGRMRGGAPLLARCMRVLSLRLMTRVSIPALVMNHLSLTESVVYREEDAVVNDTPCLVRSLQFSPNIEACV